MTTNPFINAARAKGLSALTARARTVASRYGMTAGQMDRALEQFARTLGQYDCGATFPITAVALQRHRSTVEKYLGRKIEFAVHGYTHVDYSQLSDEQQRDHLERARQVFTEAGINPLGFRSPYLSRDDRLNDAIQDAGFCYVSNQPFLWDALDAAALDGPGCAGYDRAVAYYRPWQAPERLSLPRFVGRQALQPGALPLVEIPVSLPDDEILIERLGAANGTISDAWRRILAQTHRRGELFTLQLHPERIGLCAGGLADVLSEARSLGAAVWQARLSEAAAWWQARARASAEIAAAGDGEFWIRISAPAEATVLARAVETRAECTPWGDGWQRVHAREFSLRAAVRPSIGLSARTSPAAASFLRQQGFFVEAGARPADCALYLDRPEFAPEDESALLAQIESGAYPLVRLGRWPNAARSALAITGDVDALTLWDYGLRFLGR